MLRKSAFLAVAFALACGVSVRADAVTTNATFNIPGGSSVPNVIHIDTGSNAGISYTNSFSNGTVTLGDTVRVVGAGLVASYTVGPPPGGANNIGGTHNIVGVVALSGIQVAAPAGTGLAAQFTVGTLRFFDTGNTSFFTNIPQTWISNTILGTYTLKFQTTGVHETVIQGATSGPFDGSQVNQPGATQDFGTANVASPFNTNTNLLFLGTQGLLSPVAIPPGGFGAGLFVQANGAILNATDGGDNGLGASGITALNNISNMLIGLPFTGGGAGQDFAPQPAPFANGDVSEELGIAVNPIFQTSATTTAPEPASMLLWAMLAGGIGVYGGIRRYCRKVAA